MVSDNQAGQHRVTLHLAITVTLYELSKIWYIACGFPWNRKLLLSLMQVGPLPLVQDTANYSTVPGDEYLGLCTQTSLRRES